MARMVVLVVLVILWRFPGVMRMPERSQVVRLLLRRTRLRIGLLLDGRQRWTRRLMGSVVLLVLRRWRRPLLRGMRRRGVLLLMVLDGRRRRRRWLRVGGCLVVVLGLGIVGWWRTVVTRRGLGVGRTRSDRFHDERKMQPCGQGWSMGLPVEETIGGARTGRGAGRWNGWTKLRRVAHE